MTNPVDDWPAFPIGKIGYNAKGQKVFVGGLPPEWEKTKQKSKDIPTGNAGLVPEKKRFVIDIDNGPRKQEALGCLYKLPGTRLAETPSGGLHGFFNCPDVPVGNAIFLDDKAGEIRRGNAFVVRPGSVTTKGTGWKLINSLPVATVKWKEVQEAFAPFLKGEKKTEASAREVLADNHPREEERVSCTMKLLAMARLTNPNISMEEAHNEICARIKKDNNWDDYNEDFTSKKVWGVLKKYFNKKNPKEPEKPTTPSTRNLKPRTFAEIKNMKPNKDYIVENLIIPGTTIMLFGQPACSKSVFADLIALTVSTGKPFIDFKTKKKNVLLVDNENGLTLLQERFTSLYNGLKLRRSPKNFWVISRCGSLDTTENVMQLNEICAKNNIDLVLMDTLRRCTAAEENSSSEINLFFQTTIIPLLEQNICVVFLHHSQKGKDYYRGSSDLLGFVDSAFAIEKTGDKIKIRCEKSRGAEPDTIIAEWSFEKENIQLIRLDEIDEERKTKSMKREISENIMHVFRLHDHLKRSEIIDLLEIDGYDYALATIKQSLKYLLLSRQLTKDNKGKYAKTGQEQINSLK